MTQTSDDTPRSEETEEYERSRKAPKRGSVFSRMALYYRQVIAELRKVVWPSRTQLITYTNVVIVFVLIVMAFVFALDFVFTKAIFWIFA